MQADTVKYTKIIDRVDHLREGDSILGYDIATAENLDGSVLNAEERSVSHFVIINKIYVFPSVTKFLSETGVWVQLHRGLDVGTSLRHQTKGWFEIETLKEVVTDQPVNCSFIEVPFANLFRQGILVHNGGGGGCFPAGTLIRMADKTKKPIEDVLPGEAVLSYDLDNYLWSTSTISSTYSLKVSSLSTISFTDGSQLKVTEGHPVYGKDNTKQGWFAVSTGKASKECPGLTIVGSVLAGCQLRVFCG